MSDPARRAATLGVPASLPNELRQRVDVYLTAQHLREQVRQVTLLSGDASTRRYLRVQLQDAASQILAVYPEPFDVPASSYAKVAALLHAVPVPAPATLHWSSALGIIGLQDLGDCTLQTCVADANASETEQYYQRAIDLLVALQRRAAELAGPEVPYTLAFDIEKLTWELRFFEEHFLSGLRRQQLKSATRQALGHEWLRVAEELASEPRVVCHRDYHSRNLMVHDGQLWVIDFQDARMGPDTYDLASLLRDSYVELDADLRSKLVTYFLNARARESGEQAPARAEFDRRFDTMALQRNLKALGTFGYQTQVRGVSTYLPAIPPTLCYVRDTLDRNPRFGRMRELLAEHVPELA